MDKIQFALKLAKDCTYADEMTEGAKQYLRNAIDEALNQALHLHSVMQAEGSDVSEGAAVGNSAAGQNGSDGDMCIFARNKRCECEADRECTLM